MRTSVLMLLAAMILSAASVLARPESLHPRRRTGACKIVFRDAAGDKIQSDGATYTDGVGGVQCYVLIAAGAAHDQWLYMNITNTRRSPSARYIKFVGQSFGGASYGTFNNHEGGTFEVKEFARLDPGFPNLVHNVKPFRAYVRSSQFAGGYARVDADSNFTGWRALLLDLVGLRTANRRLLVDGHVVHHRGTDAVDQFLRRARRDSLRSTGHADLGRQLTQPSGSGGVPDAVPGDGHHHRQQGRLPPAVGRTLRRNQRISHPHTRKPAEVPVGGPQLVDAVVDAERGDARVVDLRAADAPASSAARSVGQWVPDSASSTARGDSSHAST